MPRTHRPSPPPGARGWHEGGPGGQEARHKARANEEAQHQPDHCRGGARPQTRLEVGVHRAVQPPPVPGAGEGQPQRRRLPPELQPVPVPPVLAEAARPTGGGGGLLRPKGLLNMNAMDSAGIMLTQTKSSIFLEPPWLLPRFHSSSLNRHPRAIQSRPAWETRPAAAGPRAASERK